MYTINTQLNHTLLKAAQLVVFMFQAFPESSTLLNEEQTNFSSRESFTSGQLSTKLTNSSSNRLTQAGILAYVVASCSLDFVFGLGRIITHYEYAFTSG